MALTEERPEILELESGDTSASTGAFARPTNATGWRAWVFTVDHKKIGIMYGVVAMFWFLWGGIEALLIRAQLFTPNGTVLTAEQYNQIFTMHGTTMVFLVIMPLAAAFANYIVPLSRSGQGTLRSPNERAWTMDLCIWRNFPQSQLVPRWRT